tara:strand:+ start:3164 stop:4039 length:876 start_codon:yes stop_codon:yes gene_type:complete
MKPTFLLCGGVGWCATNPLRYTLKDVCNVGKLREHHYLKVLEGTGDTRKIEKHCRKYSQEETTLVRELLQAPVSLESYITYYKKLYESTDIPMVGDASNTNYMLSEKFLASIVPELEKHFNVKAYMIFRDPVRRAWSHINFAYFDTRIRLIRMSNGNRSNESFNEFLNRQLMTDWSTMYIQQWEMFQRHVDTLPIVMEELWEGDTETELELISAHIGERVDTVYENVYSPDRGVNRDPSNENLKDQWSSDYLELTPEVYFQIKEVLQPTYDAWALKFGSLPKHWGHPYDYQ